MQRLIALLLAGLLLFACLHELLHYPLQWGTTHLTGQGEVERIATSFDPEPNDPPQGTGGSGTR